MMFGTGQVSRGIAHHPYIIKKLEELPESLLRLAYNYTELLDSVDFMMVVPNQTFLKGLFGRRFVPQQALLFYPEGVLHLQDARSPDRSGQATWIEGRDLRWLCSSLLLLYGKLEIMAEKGSTVQKIEVEYNTVAHDLVKPFIQRFLQSAWTDIPPVIEDQLQFDLPEFSQLPYKFQSGLRIYALQPQEKICGLAFQPEILQPRLRLLRRKVSPNTLLALSDRQVVLIQEEIASTSNYGWVITHFPRQHIRKIDSDPFNEWQALHILAGVSSGVESKTVILDPTIAEKWLHITAAIS
jgi:hypothetical protein